MPKVRGERILIFGDSLSSGQFSPGEVMGDHLRDAGATVMVNAKVGRSANNFYGRENVATQLAAVRAFDPTIVIVELGTNDLGLSMTVDLAKMTRLRDDLTGGRAQAWAFGPPSFPAGAAWQHLIVDTPATMLMMRKVFGNQLLDLRPLTKDMQPAGQNGRAADGIHFSAAGGKSLGERMATTFLGAGASGGAFLAVAAALLVVWWAWK